MIYNLNDPLRWCIWQVQSTQKLDGVYWSFLPPFLFVIFLSISNIGEWRKTVMFTWVVGWSSASFPSLCFIFSGVIACPNFRPLLVVEYTLFIIIQSFYSSGSPFSRTFQANEFVVALKHCTGTALHLHAPKNNMSAFISSPKREVTLERTLHTCATSPTARAPLLARKRRMRLISGKELS